MTTCKCMRKCKKVMPEGGDGWAYTYFEWTPRKDPKNIISCPNCKSRAWRIPPAPKKVESLEERNRRIIHDEMNNAFPCLDQLCPFCNPKKKVLPFDATPGGRCS